MIFLKTRRGAAAVSAVIMCLAVILGMNMSLKRQTNKVESLFYDGVYIKEANYRSPSIDDQLKTRIDAAMNLLTLARRYDVIKAETDSLANARNTLYDAKSITEKWRANEALEKAYVAVCDKLDELITEDENDIYLNALRDMTGAQDVIRSNLYNNEVSEYHRKVLNKFPISTLRFLIAADPPEFYGVEG